MRSLRKPSGLAWTATIPAHWDVAKVCLIARLESGHTPSRQHPEYWVPEECTVPWFSLADVWQLREANQKYLGDTSENISFRGMANSAARLLPPGTVVLSRTASVGYAGVMPRPMATTQDFANWICGPRLVPGYLLWVFRAMKPDFARMMMGSTHQTIYMPDIRRLATPVPSVLEQRAIADFLDRKTAAIDALIEKKRLHVGLLMERRYAVLTRAVTEGLDPEGPKRPTGLPWFQRVPAHWTTTKLKHISRQVTVGIVVTPAKYYVDEGVPALRSFNIHEGYISDDDLAYISRDANEVHRKSKLREGDLVAVRTGQPGTTAVVDARFAGANCVDLIIARRSVRFRSRFACYFMNSAPAHQQYGEGCEGALQQHFNVETAANLVMPLPPLHEQDAVVQWLDRKLGHIDEIIAAIEHEVSVLRQYRQALITAAVTGQLDVAQEAA